MVLERCLEVRRRVSLVGEVQVRGYERDERGGEKVETGGGLGTFGGRAGDVFVG